MLVISKPISTGQALNYHREQFVNAQERYYTEDNGVKGSWHGKLAAEWGLQGEVSEEQFARLAAGQDPITGEQIVRHQAARAIKSARGEARTTLEHRAGFDATFSAPKSVSITALVGGDQRIIDAHRESVQVALDELEGFAQARMGGNMPAQTTAAWAVAQFLHDSSRPVDGYEAPQLHTHAFIFNVTKDREGIARALQPHELYKSQRYATAVYRSELAVRLRALGYELERGKHGQPEIKGYSEEYLLASSPRSEQIAQYLQRKNLSGAEAAHYAAQSTRESKLKGSKEEVRAQHLKAAELHGNQHLAVMAQAQQQRVAAPTQAMRKDLSEEGMRFATDRAMEREAIVDQRDLLSDVLRHGMGDVRLQDAREKLLEAIAHGQLQVSERNAVSPAMQFTTPAMVELERETIQKMIAGQGTQEAIVGGQMRAEMLSQQANFYESQKQALEEILASKDRIFALEGLAGTGKTTLLEAVRKSAEEAGYTLKGLTPTSRSAQKLAEAGIETETIQRFLKREAKPADGKQILYVLDESSMVSTQQMHGLFERMGTQGRALLVGDTRQHESVEAGRPYAMLQEAGMHTAHLSEIIRQKDPELKKSVEHFAEGRILEGLGCMVEQWRIREIEDRSERIEAIAQEYLKNPAGTLVVSPDNASRAEINERIHQMLRSNANKQGDDCAVTVLSQRQNMTAADRMWAQNYNVGDTIRFSKSNQNHGFHAGECVQVASIDVQNNQLTVTRQNGTETIYCPRLLYGVGVFERQEKHFAPGDRLQLTLPYYPEKLANRQLGTVQEIDAEGNLRLQMDSGKDVAFNVRQHPHLDYGYAVTSHSSQCETVDRVLIHIDSDLACKGLINTRMAYVSVSRARHDALIFTNDSASLGQELSRDISHLSALTPAEIKLEQELSMVADRKHMQSWGMSIG